jgi:thymidylate synthase (FAD)
MKELGNTSEWNRKVEVLNSGFVQIIDFMGTDESISQAARVSYAKGTRKVSEDRDLIRFLMRHEHYSPFSMAQVKFHLRLPLFVHAQFIRHDRFSWNMMSGRYSVMPDEKWQPILPDDIRGQGSGNKQVGSGKLSEAAEEDAFIAVESSNHRAQLDYQELLGLGVCREQARTVLPQGQYTEGVVTANLGDWMLLLKQRLDSHAQQEIRVYAEAIQQILNQLFPISMEAFRDYQLNRVVLSAREYSALKLMLSFPEEYCVESAAASQISNRREQEEFIAKFRMD